jgi:D-glycero-D-manno-heptose 1,7-bisphosphate phosphatase
MLDQFSMHNICIDRVYYCPFHPTAGIGKYRQDSFDRKPNPGMILRAKKDFNLDLSKSVLVGDKDSDIQAGIAAGIGYNVLLASKTPKLDEVDYLHYKSVPAITTWMAGKFSSCR